MFEQVDLRHLEILGFERYQEQLYRAATRWPDCTSRPRGTRYGRLFCQSMAWLGRRLAAWGWSLQERFDEATPASVMSNAVSGRSQV